MVDVATGSYEDLPHDTHSFSPTWNPTADWQLVYDGDMDLVSLDLNRGESWLVTDDLRDPSPSFSPGGTKLAVSYKQGENWDIHVLNPGGSGRVRLTETSLYVTVQQSIAGQDPQA